MCLSLLAFATADAKGRQDSSKTPNNFFLLANLDLFDSIFPWSSVFNVLNAVRFDEQLSPEDMKVLFFPDTGLWRAFV